MTKTFSITLDFSDIKDYLIKAVTEELSDQELEKLDHSLVVPVFTDFVYQTIKDMVQEISDYPEEAMNHNQCVLSNSFLDESILKHIRDYKNSRNDDLYQDYLAEKSEAEYLDNPNKGRETSTDLY